VGKFTETGLEWHSDAQWLRRRVGVSCGVASVSAAASRRCRLRRRVGVSFSFSFDKRIARYA
jgi:hypothetical protein